MWNFNKFFKISEFDKYVYPSYGLLNIVDWLNIRLHISLLFSKYDNFSNEFNSLFLIFISFFWIFFEKLNLFIVSKIFEIIAWLIFPLFISDIYIIKIY